MATVNHSTTSVDVDVESREKDKQSTTSVHVDVESSNPSTPAAVPNGPMVQPPSKIALPNQKSLDSVASENPITTWDTLKELGFTKEEVLKRCQAERGNTLRGVEDLHLNDEFANKQLWNCHNVILAQPVQVLRTTSTIRSTKVIKVYDNSQGDKELDVNFSHEVTRNTAATLTIHKPAKINLNGSITIHNVGLSGWPLTIDVHHKPGDALTKSAKESKTSHSELKVNAGDKLTVTLVTTEVTDKSTYSVAYGLNADGEIATDGKPYGSPHPFSRKSFSLNKLLDNPTGSIVLTGTFTRKRESFELTTCRTSEWYSL